MGPFDNSAARHRRRYNTSASGIFARVRRAAEKGGFGIHSGPVYLSLSRLSFQPSSTPCDLTNTRLLRAPRTTLRNIWWHFFGYRGLRRNPSSTHSIVPTASRSFILSPFLSCARARAFHAPICTQRCVSRETRVMYSCTHTPSPRVCTVYRSPRVHTKTTVSAIGLLCFLPLSSLFLFLPFYIYRIVLSLSLSFDLTYLEERRGAAFFVAFKKTHAASHRAERIARSDGIRYVRLGRVSERACVPPAVSSRDRSATVVPPPFRPPSANGRR